MTATVTAKSQVTISKSARGEAWTPPLHLAPHVDFSEDMSYARKGYGATDMAIARCFAINLVRAFKAERTLDTSAKSRGAPEYLAKMREATLRNPALSR